MDKICAHWLLNQQEKKGMRKKTPQFSVPKKNTETCMTSRLQHDSCVNMLYRLPALSSP